MCTEPNNGEFSVPEPMELKVKNKKRRENFEMNTLE